MTKYNSRAASRRPATAGRKFSGSSRRNQKSSHRGAYIHPSKFINKATITTTETVYESKHTFKDFGFQSILQHNLDKKGFTKPSAIQDQAIKPILEGKDVVGLANTGTGKTAAFVLPLIEKLIGRPPQPTVLIMAPTRELALQINDEFKIFSQGLRLFSALVVGGTDINRQIRELKRGQHVIIGTPGRLRDLMNRGQIDLSKVACLVLDEADRMLDMGFVNDIRSIIQDLPEKRQTLFFSATITQSIRVLIDEFLTDHIEISVRTADTSERVDQDVLYANTKEEKLEQLIALLQSPEFEKTLVFGETKFGVQRLSDHIEKIGISSVAIHGNKSQPQRQRALRAFKDNTAKVMVATDVAARGLDIPNVTHVINFDQPMTYEDYVHRIGRTGRAGATGKALTFVPRNNQ